MVEAGEGDRGLGVTERDSLGGGWVEGGGQSLRQRRDAVGAGWDANDRQPDESLPLAVEVTGPEGRLPLARATATVQARHSELSAPPSAEQENALRNLLQGVIAREVADKLQVAGELVTRINGRLDSISTAHGIGVSLRWRRRDDLDVGQAALVSLLAKRPDLRTEGEDERLRDALSTQLDYVRREDPDSPYRDLLAGILEYRSWYEMILVRDDPDAAAQGTARRPAVATHSAVRG